MAFWASHKQPTFQREQARRSAQRGGIRTRTGGRMGSSWGKHRSNMPAPVWKVSTACTSQTYPIRQSHHSKMDNNVMNYVKSRYVYISCRYFLLEASRKYTSTIPTQIPGVSNPIADRPQVSFSLLPLSLALCYCSHRIKLITSWTAVSIVVFAPYDCSETVGVKLCAFLGSNTSHS